MTIKRTGHPARRPIATTNLSAKISAQILTQFTGSLLNSRKDYTAQSSPPAAPECYKNGQVASVRPQLATPHSFVWEDAIGAFIPSSAGHKRSPVLLCASGIRTLWMRPVQSSHVPEPPKSGSTALECAICSSSSRAHARPTRPMVPARRRDRTKIGQCGHS